MKTPKWRERLAVAGLAIALACPGLVRADTAGTESIPAQINAMLEDLPYVKAETRGNEIAVSGWVRDEKERAVLDRVLAKYPEATDLCSDRLPTDERMVEVDVIIVVVGETESRSTGFDFLQLINFQYDFFDTRHNRFGNGFTGPGSQGLVVNRHQWGRMLSASVDYNVNIANATDESVSIIARPHLATLSSEPADFLAGGEIVFKVSGINSGDIKPYSFGIGLKVTPTMLPIAKGDDRERVELDVEASRISVLGRLLANEFNDDINFDKTEVKSKALLELDETLILSGLYQREYRRRFSGTPILRAIPIVNLLFSNTTEIDDVQSTVVFLTPRDPTLLNEENQRQIEYFITRRKAYVKAVNAGTESAIDEFKDEFPDWYKPRQNSMATHIFMRENSQIYRSIRGDDLRADDLERGILAVDSARSARKKRQVD